MVYSILQGKSIKIVRIPHTCFLLKRCIHYTKNKFFLIVGQYTPRFMKEHNALVNLVIRTYIY